MTYLPKENISPNDTEMGSTKILQHTFRNENFISKSIIERTIKHFEEIRSVRNRTIPGRPMSATVKEKALDYCTIFC